MRGEPIYNNKIWEIYLGSKDGDVLHNLIFSLQTNTLMLTIQYLCNPDNISNFLLLEFYIRIKDSKLELLHKTSLIQEYFMFKEFIFKRFIHTSGRFKK